MTSRSSPSASARTRRRGRSRSSFTKPTRRAPSRTSRSSPARRLLQRHRLSPRLSAHPRADGRPAEQGARTAPRSAPAAPATRCSPEIRRKHTKGAVAAARLPDKINPSRVSNGSQFFVCLAPMPAYDGQYTVFGHVIYGLDTLDAISDQARGQQRLPGRAHRHPLREDHPARSSFRRRRPRRRPAPAPKKPWWQIFWHKRLRRLRARTYKAPPFPEPGRYRSGQTGRTVNPLAYAFAGSNPALPTALKPRKDQRSQAISEIPAPTNGTAPRRSKTQ